MCHGEEIWCAMERKSESCVMERNSKLEPMERKSVDMAPQLPKSIHLSSGHPNWIERNTKLSQRGMR